MVVPKPVGEEKFLLLFNSQVFVVISSSMCQDSQCAIHFEAGQECHHSILLLEALLAGLHQKGGYEDRASTW